MNQQPPIQEVTTFAKTAKWNQLGVTLQLDSVKLVECHDCTSMYQLWIMEKARDATRRNLLNALSAIRQNNVAMKYKDYLKTIVSYIVHSNINVSMYIEWMDLLVKKNNILLSDIDILNFDTKL